MSEAPGSRFPAELLGRPRRPAPAPLAAPSAPVQAVGGTWHQKRLERIPSRPSGHRDLNAPGQRASCSVELVT